MPGNFEIRGVPRSIALDAWWLGATIASTGEAEDAHREKGSAGLGISGARRRKWPGTLLLVLLGDFLFWGHAIGLSLAIFAMVLVVIAGIGHPARSAGMSHHWRPSLALATAGLGWLLVRLLLHPIRDLERFAAAHEKGESRTRPCISAHGNCTQPDGGCPKPHPGATWLTLY